MYGMAANTDHPVYRQPHNPNVKIWRYMDFAKYVALLEESALWFSRADKLGESSGDRWGDPFEGTISRGTLQMLSNLRSSIRIESQESVSKERILELIEYEKLVEFHIESTKVMREWTYVNSWHMNERESAAMWRLYARTNEAVAVQSTYAKLRDCLPASTEVGKVDMSGLSGTWVTEASPVYLGVVQYIDYATEPMPQGNAFHPFIYKRKSFEHEHELRAVIHAVPLVEKPEGGAYLPQELTNLESGRLVQVVLEDLIEGVYVAPTAPTWFRKVVQAVTRKYGLAHKTSHSSLDEAPLL
jgi:hypothetical protein